jgi:hypothetical protein
MKQRAESGLEFNAEPDAAVCVPDPRGTEEHYCNDFKHCLDDLIRQVWVQLLQVPGGLRAQKSAENEF